MASIPHLHAADVKFDPAGLSVVQARLRALKRRTIDVAAKRAAVVVPLCHARGVPSVLFTKRTETVSTHKGQVSFPGGRRDPSDLDDVACALRELHEEVGLQGVHVLGRFHEAMSITQVCVTPVVAYVGAIDDVAALSISRDEIDVAFTLSIVELCDPSKVQIKALGPFQRAPFFVAGPHPVWGLTAFILHEVMREVLGLPVAELS